MKRTNSMWKMSFVLGLCYFLWKTLKKSKMAIVRARYSDRTVAEYFREQGAQIGENCDILASSLGTEPYLVTIGSHVFISEGVVFHTHDGGVWIFREELPDIRVQGNMVIEDNCLKSGIVYGGRSLDCIGVAKELVTM